MKMALPTITEIPVAVISRARERRFFVLNPLKDGVLNNDAIYTSPDDADISDVTRHLNLCEQPLSQQSPPRAVACSIDGIARDDYRALN